MDKEKPVRKPNPVTEERKGQFVLGWPAIQEQYDVAKLILNDVVVVKADDSFTEQRVMYWAFSEKFRKVPVGEQMPEYDSFVHLEPREDDPTQSKMWVEWIEKKA